MKKRSLPHKFMIGLQRAGSTYTYGLFQQHPNVSLSNLKEIGFYSDSSKYDKGVDWYLDTFERDGDKIDISPKYFMKPDEVLPRMKNTLKKKNPKFLLILRNPIYYIYSHFKYHHGYDYFKNNPQLYPKYSKDLITFLKMYPSYLDRADYYNILTKKWFKYYDSSCFKIVIFEDFIKNPKNYIEEVNIFFEFDNIKLKNNPIDQNARKPFKIIYLLTEWVNKYPTLKQMLYKSTLFVKMYKAFVLKFREEPNKKEIAFLKERYAEQVEKLSTLSPKALEYWTEFKN